MTYTVVKGDTLSEIGKKKMVDWVEIAKINNIHSPYLIYPGQILKMPENKKVESKKGGTSTMTVDITPFIKDAQALQKATGIPASITLGQIILESSGKYPGGLSGLAYEGKNLFGIKGTGNAGSVTMKTTEFVRGKAVKVDAQFRKYKSYYDSMVDHAKILSAARYAKYLKTAKSVNDYANGIAKGGYATSPTYAQNLLHIISIENLHQYDIGNFPLHL